jgi:hypothetical protein
MLHRLRQCKKALIRLRLQTDPQHSRPHGKLKCPWSEWPQFPSPWCNSKLIPPLAHYLWGKYLIMNVELVDKLSEFANNLCSEFYLTYTKKGFTLANLDKLFALPTNNHISELHSKSPSSNLLSECVKSAIGTPRKNYN